jgi:formate-dependent nitrite reductase membrane component NrfD
VLEAALIDAQLQRRWDIHHATWFSLMGIGGGIFILSRLADLEMRLGLWLGLPLVDLVSFVAIGVGGLVLIADLGRPLRFIRALARPGTSWISRGAIADFVFLVVGGALVLPGLDLMGARPFARLPWDAAASNRVGWTLEVLALLSAAVVVYYAGQVLADRTHVPYWRSPAIPVQFVLSSLAASMGVVMLMQVAQREPIGAGQFGFVIAALGLLMIAVILHLRTDAEAPGKRESLEHLLRGRYRVAFLWGVVGAGTALPMVLAAVAIAAPPARPALGVLCLLCTLTAGFALRLITLRVGFYRPLTSALRVPKR